jgi:predicted permease
VAAVSSNRSWTRDVKTQRSLAVLGGAVVFLLVIVCANLASLSLSRTLARARDCAVRAALGASRADLVRETMVENLAIGAMGAIAGVGVAAAALEVTVRWLPTAFTSASMNAIDLDGRMLVFTAACGIVTALLFGLAPALLASRAGVSGLLARGSRSTTGSPASRRLRSALVVVEVALAIVLLVGAALMTRSFVKLQQVDRGFEVSGLVAMRLGLPASRYLDPYARDAFVDEMVSRSQKLAGVTSSTSGGVPPDSNIISFGKIEFAHRPGTLSEELVLPVYQVWPNYFTSVGIPIRAGRAFAADEPRESTIVSESFARAFWPGGDAVGSRFRFEGSTSWRTIVGIAGEVRQFDMEDANGSFEFFYPLRRPPGLPAPATQNTAAIIDYRTMVVRTTDVGAAMAGLRQLVHEVDPRVVIWRLDPVERLFAEAIARPRVVLLLMAVFASLGLILAAAGIYAVLSYLVTQRRREIGLRLALGARPERIRRLVVGNGLTLTAVGLVIGVPAALALMRLMRTLLYDVATSDPWSLTVVAGIVTGVATLASWWPARRAAAVDPVGLLRED